jgi:hypothetical protein
MERMELYQLTNQKLLATSDIVTASKTSNPYVFLMYRLLVTTHINYIITFTDARSIYEIILLYAAALLNLSGPDDERMTNVVSSKISQLQKMHTRFVAFVPRDFASSKNPLVFAEVIKQFAMIHIGEIPFAPSCVREINQNRLVAFGTMRTFLHKIVVGLLELLRGVYFSINDQKMNDLIGHGNVSKSELMGYTIRELSNITDTGGALKPVNNPSLFLAFFLINKMINTHGFTMMHELNILTLYASDHGLLLENSEHNKFLHRLSHKGYTIGQIIMRLGRDSVSMRHFGVVPYSLVAT